MPPATTPFGKAPSVNNEYKAGWAPGPVSMFLRNNKSLCPAGNWTPDCPAHNHVSLFQLHNPSSHYKSASGRVCVNMILLHNKLQQKCKNINLYICDDAQFGRHQDKPHTTMLTCSVNNATKSHTCPGKVIRVKHFSATDVIPCLPNASIHKRLNCHVITVQTTFAQH
jgi:hypothetical protein